MEARKRNPKAFALQNVVKTERRTRRKEDITEKRSHVPTVDRTPVEPPPIVVGIVGPPKVGKSTLMRGLIKNFTKQNLTNIQASLPNTTKLAFYWGKSAEQGNVLKVLKGYYTSCFFKCPKGGKCQKY